MAKAVASLAALSIYHANGAAISSTVYQDVSFSPFGRPLSEAVGGFRLSGHSQILGDSIRLTEDKQAQSGTALAIHPAKDLGKTWRADVSVRISGNAVTLAGDGMAFWYTRSPIAAGRALGGQQTWTGLGLFIDTYNNNPDQHSLQHPYISVMLNDGTVVHEHDGSGTHTTLHAPAGCSAQVRQMGMGQRITTIRLSYDGYSRRLVGKHTSGSQPGEYMSKPDEEWTPCFDLTLEEGLDSVIRPGYFFGLSSSTGDLADNHDVISLLVYGEENASEADVAEEVKAAWAQYKAEGRLDPRPVGENVVAASADTDNSGAVAANDGLPAAGPAVDQQHAGDEPGAPPHQHDEPANDGAVASSDPHAGDDANAPAHEHEPEGSTFGSSSGAADAEAAAAIEAGKAAAASVLTANDGSGHDHNHQASAGQDEQEHRMLEAGASMPNPAHEQQQQQQLQAEQESQSAQNRQKLDADELNSAIQDATVIRYLRTRIEESSRGIGGITKQMDTRIDGG